MSNEAAGTTHPSRGASPRSPAVAVAVVDENGKASTTPPSQPLDDIDDLDEYAWTSPSPPLSASDPLHAALRDFDRDLRCPVCHDFYRIPVSLPSCHHTFCSECIRVSLRASVKVRRVSECPVCRQRADERRVVPNRCVEGIVRRFVELRGGLRERLMAAGSPVDNGRAGGSAAAAAAGSGSRGGEVAVAGGGGDDGGEGDADPSSPAPVASSASVGGRRTSSRVSSRVTITCPISGMLFEDPVRNRVCGHTYSRAGVGMMFRNNKHKCPIPGCGNYQVTEEQLEEDMEMAMRVQRHQRRVRKEEEEQRARDRAMEEEEDDEEEEFDYDIVDDGDSDFEESPARRPPPTAAKAKAKPAKRGRGRPPKNRPSPPAPAAPPPPPAAVVGTVPRRRTSTHYHGLKRKQLQDLLAREGLSTAGGEREMRDRHAEFVTLVNSECDAERPRSEEELRAELARRERARREERAASMHNGAMRDAECMERLKRARKAAGEAEAVAVGGGGVAASAATSTNGPSPSSSSSVAVSSGNAAFDGALDAGFRRLIADARRKRRRLKEGGGGGGVTAAEERGVEGDEGGAGEFRERSGGGDGADGAAIASGGVTSADANANAASSLPVLDSSSSLAAVVVRPPAAATTPDGVGGNEGSMAAPTSSQKKPRADVGRGRGPTRPFGPSPTGSATAAASSPPTAASAGSISGPWNCGTCTFLNTVRVWTNARCEMCEVGRRPGPGGCRRSSKPDHVVEVDC